MSFWDNLIIEIIDSNTALSIQSKTKSLNWCQQSFASLLNNFLNVSIRATSLNDVKYETKKVFEFFFYEKKKITFGLY